MLLRRARNWQPLQTLCCGLVRISVDGRCDVPECERVLALEEGSELLEKLFIEEDAHCPATTYLVCEQSLTRKVKAYIPALRTSP